MLALWVKGELWGGNSGEMGVRTPRETDSDLVSTLKWEVTEWEFLSRRNGDEEFFPTESASPERRKLYAPYLTHMQVLEGL